MPIFIFNKLVRDKLQDEYKRMGQKAVYRTLSKSELSAALANKMIEEIREIPEDGTKDDIASELADVRQAMDDLMHLHGITETDIQTLKQKKFDKKGGFAEGAFVESLELKDDDEWVEYYRKEPAVFLEVQPKFDELVETVPFIEAGIYEHYKGKRYEVVGVGLDSETTKPVVVYTPQYESTIPFYVRPYEMFLEFVEVDGKKVERFRKINESRTTPR